MRVRAWPRQRYDRRLEVPPKLNMYADQRIMEEEEKPTDEEQMEEAPESAGKSDNDSTMEEQEQEEPPPTEEALVDEDSTTAVPKDGEKHAGDKTDVTENIAEEAPEVPPPAQEAIEDESPAVDQEEKDPGEAEAETEAEAGSESTDEEPTVPLGANEEPENNEASQVNTNDSTAATAEEALEVIDEIAKVEGESPEEILEELHEEAEDLEYFEEELDELGDDLAMAEEEIDQMIAEEIAEEMGVEVDNEIDVPEDLSGKGMISTDATSYGLSSPVEVSFEIDPFLPGDWVGLYPFDAAYHDYDTDTVRVPHPSVEWLFLCGSHDCDGNVDSGESSLEFFSVEEGKWKVFLLRDSWGQSGSEAMSYLVIAESETFVVGNVDEESFGKVSGELGGEESGSISSRLANGQISNTTVAGITAMVCIVLFLFIGWKLSKRRDSRGHAVPSSAVELAEQGEWT